MGATTQVTGLDAFSIQDGQLSLDSGTSSAVFGVYGRQQKEKISLITFQNQVWPDRDKQVIDLIALRDHPLNDALSRSRTRALHAIAESGNREKFIGEFAVSVTDADTAIVCDSSRAPLLCETDPSFAVDYASEPHLPALRYSEGLRSPSLRLRDAVTPKVLEMLPAKPTDEFPEVSTASNGACTVRLSRRTSSGVVGAFIRASRLLALPQVRLAALLVEVRDWLRCELRTANLALGHGRMLGE